MSRAFRGRPVLSDQGRAVGRDRSVGLVPEQELGDAGAGEGVDEAEEDREDHDRDD